MEILLSCLYFILTVMFLISAIQNKKNKNKSAMILNILTAICFGLTGILHLIQQ